MLSSPERAWHSVLKHLRERNGLAMTQLLGFAFMVPTAKQPSVTFVSQEYSVTWSTPLLPVSPVPALV